MFELQAYSSGGVNVAMQGTAIQSSTYANNQKFAASMAIDGNNSTFSHTQDLNAFWEIDFNGLVDIEQVVIQNRWCGSESDPNNCLCRLSNAQLMLTNTIASTVVSSMIGDTCGTLVLREKFTCL